MRHWFVFILILTLCFFLQADAQIQQPAPSSGSGNFSSISSGVNTSAAMVVDTGASITAIGTGSIIATNMPGDGLTSPVLDSMIPPLNTLSTTLTPLRCVETDATGKLISATAACNTGSGGSGTWGGITGTLSNQTDLQAALDAKVATSVTVNAHPLSSNVSISAGDVGLGNVNNTSDATKNAATAILENKQIVTRVSLLTVTANHVTPNMDTTDVAYNYSFAAGLTIDNPTFTGSNPRDQQVLTLEFKTAAPQTLAFGTMYNNECGLPLPTGTTGDIGGSATYNRFLFRYSTTSSKLCLIASTKGDSTRITTLAQAGTSPNYTLTCPADNSDTCELQETRATGTLTVQIPGGSPQNGQRLRLSIMCVNSQTIAWNAIFIDGAVTTKPTSCIADSTKWLTLDMQYSTTLTKWSLVGSGGTPALPGTVVKTDQANTYTTGAQNFGSATSLVLPKAAGAAPTADGDIRYDTTQDKVVFGENGLATTSPSRILCTGDSGSSNNASSGAGSDFNHTPTCTIPANYWLQHRLLRACGMLTYTTTTTVPTFTHKLKLGSTVVLTTSTITPPVSLTGKTITLCWLLLAEGAPGASVNVRTAPGGGPYDAIGYNDNTNRTTQPIVIATNASQALTVTTLWGSTISGNIVTLSALYVEALN